MSDYNQPEYLDDTDPEKNWDFYRQDHGGMVTNHNGMADKLFQNDDLYRSMKGDWKRASTNKRGNIVVTTGREDGKFDIKRDKTNKKTIKTAVKNYTTRAKFGNPDPSTTTDDLG